MTDGGVHGAVASMSVASGLVFRLQGAYPDHEELRACMPRSNIGHITWHSSHQIGHPSL